MEYYVFSIGLDSVFKRKGCARNHCNDVYHNPTSVVNTTVHHAMQSRDRLMGLQTDL